ncbi:MAG: hypothetical protein NTW49_04840 [Bacteroidia bacterium]|nr:hypothetical protein [Bacteroidia bacterium]
MKIIKISNGKLITKLIFLLAGILSFTVTSVSQTDIDRDVIVVKAYTPSISDAFKISSLPKMNDTLAVHPQFEYKIHSVQSGTSYQPEPVNPAKMLTEPLPHLYGNYLRLGIGTQLDPLAEVYISNLWSRKNSWGVYFKHFSANGKTTYNGLSYYPWFSEEKAKVFGKEFFAKSTLSASLEFISNKYYYYGYNPAFDTLAKNNMKYQVYTSLALNTSYCSNYMTDDRLNYRFDIDYHYFQNKDKQHENMFALTANLDEKYHGYRLGMDAKFSYYQLAYVDVNSNNFSLIEINPYARQSGENWENKLGFKIVTKTRPFPDETDTHFYPDLNFQYTIADKILISYFSFTGNLDMNNFERQVTLNPYIGGIELNPDPTNYMKVFNAGLRGNISKFFSYDVSGSYSEISNYLFFQNDVLLPEYGLPYYAIDILPIYDNLDVWNASGRITYDNSKLSVCLKMDFNSYSNLEVLDRPLYMPENEASIDFGYNLRDKINFYADIFYIGKRYSSDIIILGPTDNAEYHSLSEIIDFNMGIEYRYTKKMSAFLKLNNFTNQKYQLWANYPCWGFNALAGVTYSF